MCAYAPCKWLPARTVAVPSHHLLLAWAASRSCRSVRFPISCLGLHHLPSASPLVFSPFACSSAVVPCAFLPETRIVTLPSFFHPHSSSLHVFPLLSSNTFFFSYYFHFFTPSSLCHPTLSYSLIIFIFFFYPSRPLHFPSYYFLFFSTPFPSL